VGTGLGNKQKWRQVPIDLYCLNSLALSYLRFAFRKGVVSLWECVRSLINAMLYVVLFIARYKQDLLLQCIYLAFNDA